MSRSRLLSRLSLTATLVALGASAWAIPPAPPNEVLYVANFAGGRIVRVNSNGSTTTIVSGLKDLSSLLAQSSVSGAIDLVACADKVILYRDVASPTFNGAGVVIANVRCNGIARNPNGDLFFVRSGPANSQGGGKEVWLIPNVGGSYGTPVQIDDNVDADSLEHVAVARTGMGDDVEANDVLVLAGGKSARVLLYRKDVNGDYGLVDDSLISFSKPDEPKGLAFVAGRLLVSLVGGQIKSFDGEWGSPSVFASGFGNGLWKIESGLQGGVYRVFATQRNAHKIKAINVVFDSGGNPVGGAVTTLTQVFNSPQDVAIGQDLTFIPASTSFTAAFNAQNITYTNVEDGGPAEQTCSLTPIEDPRESECPDDCSGTCDSGFCRRDLDVTEIGLPYPGLTIPSYVRSLKIGDPVSGVPKFFACVGTAPAFGLAEHLVHEDQFLNWQLPNPPEPACNESDTSKRSIFYRGTIPGEPPVFEGDRFVPYPTACVPGSSNRGDVDDYSVIFPAARLLLPFCTATDDGFAGLLGALGMTQLANFIDGDSGTGFEKQLIDKATEARAKWLLYKSSNLPSDQALAIGLLNQFISLVESNLTMIHNDTANRNISGELIVRARSLRYLVGEVTPALLADCAP